MHFKMTAVGGLILFFLIGSSHGLVGYDCGSNNLNITTLSLLEIGECEIPTQKIEVTQKYIQLLQLNDFADTVIRQCKVEVRRIVYHCGMYSHVSIVNNGEAEYLSEISHEACVTAHNTGTLKFSEAKLIQGLKVNQTVVHSMTFGGYLGSDGKCNGGGYADPYGSWESVVVQGTIKITLTEYTARVSLDNDRIHLRSGVTCPLTSTSCIDVEGGQTFWDPVPKDHCNFRRYSALFRGKVNKIRDPREGQLVYSIETKGITFALTATGQESICGYIIIRTEHPRLMIFETLAGDNFVETKITPTNLDLFTYINSKFIFVERLIRTQMEELYRDVVMHRCNLEREILKNSLAIATQSPDEFAYHLMKGPGYMALVAGEVVHVVKCVPVVVRVENSKECFSELQVSHKNRTLYLTPRTHILKTVGTRIPCNGVLPAYYQLGENWYRVLPKLTEALPPTIVSPKTKLTWKYANPVGLGTSGIYSEEELKDLKNMLMFPVEKPALLNDLAREMHGRPIITNEGGLSRLLSEEAIERLATSAWDKMWSRFMTFGTISAGILTIIMIFQFIKGMFNIVIRGYTLHTVYGWSIHLLGAIWGGIAHLLIYLGQQERPHPEIVTMKDLQQAPQEELLQVPEYQQLHGPYRQVQQDLERGEAFNMPS